MKYVITDEKQARIGTGFHAVLLKEILGFGRCQAKYCGTKMSERGWLVFMINGMKLCDKCLDQVTEGKVARRIKD